MAPDGKEKKWSSIPVRFFDEDEESEANEPDQGNGEFSGSDTTDEVSFGENSLSGTGSEGSSRRSSADALASGPMLAELVATRAELKRVEGELADAQERLARRQADFENY